MTRRGARRGGRGEGQEDGGKPPAEDRRAGPHPVPAEALRAKKVKEIRRYHEETVHSNVSIGGQ